METERAMRGTDEALELKYMMQDALLYVANALAESNADDLEQAAFLYKRAVSNLRLLGYRPVCEVTSLCKTEALIIRLYKANHE